MLHSGLVVDKGAEGVLVVGHAGVVTGPGSTRRKCFSASPAICEKSHECCQKRGNSSEDVGKEAIEATGRVFIELLLSLFNDVNYSIQRMDSAK